MFNPFIGCTAKPPAACVVGNGALGHRRVGGIIGEDVAGAAEGVGGVRGHGGGGDLEERGPEERREGFLRQRAQAGLETGCPPSGGLSGGHCQHELCGGHKAVTFVKCDGILTVTSKAIQRQC